MCQNYAQNLKYSKKDYIVKYIWYVSIENINKNIFFYSLGESGRNQRLKEMQERVRLRFHLY